MLPLRLQVPVKYHYGRLRHELEPEMALLPALVASGDRVIDVGGNRGTYAYRFDTLGARVEVFEPNPVCLRVLRDWATHRSSVNVHAVALSASSGTAELAIPIDAAGVEHDASASIEHGVGADVRLETVPIATLDSFGFRDASLIKIDVEGHELSVIEGALETIAASAPALLIEIEQRHLTRPIGESFARITSLGYDGFFLRSGKLAPLAEFDPQRHQVIADFENKSRQYFNNFLFLAGRHISAGRYRDILGR
ncbi:FkbM family methyltransferase [Sphingomonas aliaeris]|uniref:FkbM family methyltransferase n=1 Tax=Sphingomonas aliaeris TaxID=2759526 RepID=A0A974NX65_9SPHN|nr:FkbM family methyltransferase [Sphingomonas aliaeris]QQV78458.1 FkbM family methyltransferase [Sphingomonas aliaeris]